MKNQIDMRLLLKRLLTKHQRVLFQIQKSRAISNEPKSSSDDAIEHLADKKRIQKVESELQGFEMTTQLDKNLLLGVLKH